MNASMNDRVLIERFLLLVLVVSLGYASLQVVSPFLAPFIDATILVLATWPYYRSLSRWLGGREKLAAGLITGLMLALFVVPAVMAVAAASDHLKDLDKLANRFLQWLSAGPPDGLDAIPWLGPRLQAAWRAGDLNSLIDADKVRSLLAWVGQWMLNLSANLAGEAIMMVLAVLMAGFLYLQGEQAAAMSKRLAERIGGSFALEATRVAANTVRGVALGVIGTAFIQALLSTLGFMLAGIPAATFLGLICFLTAVIQIGTGVVWIPVAIWLTYQDSQGWAVFTVIWGLAINLMDNFIKPYFIGLSSPLPFLLIMIGVIGGMLAWGFVGIFLGTTLLAVGWTVLQAWLNSQADSPPAG